MDKWTSFMLLYSVRCTTNSSLHESHALGSSLEDNKHRPDTDIAGIFLFSSFKLFPAPLSAAPSLVECSGQCKTWLTVRTRLLSARSVNKRWILIEGKFIFEHYNPGQSFPDEARTFGGIKAPVYYDSWLLDCLLSGLVIFDLRSPLGSSETLYARLLLTLRHEQQRYRENIHGFKQTTKGRYWTVTLIRPVWRGRILSRGLYFILRLAFMISSQLKVPF